MWKECLNINAATIVLPSRRVAVAELPAEASFKWCCMIQTTSSIPKRHYRSLPLHLILFDAISASTKHLQSVKSRLRSSPEKVDVEPWRFAMRTESVLVLALEAPDDHLVCFSVIFPNVDESVSSGGD